MRIGVLGTGIMGADHANTLHRFVSGASVSALADVDPARAALAAENIPGARVSSDPVEVIAADDVDAVLIASADPFHAEQITASLEAGKPVLCEKPLALTVADCRRLTELDAAQPRPLISVGFMRRFDPGYVALKQHRRERRSGDTLLVHHISRGVSSAPGATSRSSILGSSVHEFDVIPWLLDSPIVEVSWQAPRSFAGPVDPVDPADFQDPQVMLLRTADGVLTVVETFLNARYGYDIRCEIVGSTGTMALTEPVRVVSDDALRRSTGYAADWRPRFADAYRLELQAWVDAIATGDQPPLATAQDGLRAAQICEAAIESMTSGRPAAVAGDRS